MGLFFFFLNGCVLPQFNDSRVCHFPAYPRLAFLVVFLFVVDVMRCMPGEEPSGAPRAAFTYSRGGAISPSCRAVGWLTTLLVIRGLVFCWTGTIVCFVLRLCI